MEVCEDTELRCLCGGILTRGQYYRCSECGHCYCAECGGELVIEGSCSFCLSCAGSSCGG